MDLPPNQLHELICSKQEAAPNKRSQEEKAEEKSRLEPPRVIDRPIESPIERYQSRKM